MTDDNTLVLYYYRDTAVDGSGPDDDLTDADYDRITEALKTDAALASRYEQLQRDLDGFKVDAGSKAPPEAVVRWHYEVDRAIEAETLPNRGRPLGWLAAAAAALVLGIGIGLNIGEPPATGPQTASTPPPTLTPTAPVTPVITPAAFTRGLATHMQASRVQLTTLTKAESGQRTELIARIIEQNRAFERAADANGSPGLARVLRAFEHTLDKLAIEDTPQADVAAGAEQLSFEMSVMLTKLSESASQAPYSF